MKRMFLFILCALFSWHSIATAAPNIATGVLAVKTKDGFWVQVKAPTLTTTEAVLAKSASFGKDAPSRGVPIRVYKHTAIDEPYAKPGFVPLGDNLSSNEQHTLSRTEFAWQAGFGNQTISVAVLDEPMAELHPSLSSAYDKANAYDVRNARPYVWLTPEDVDPSKGAPRTHGVEVAGVIFSDFKKIPSSFGGIPGVAPRASLMPLNVCCYIAPSGVEQRGTADDLAIANAILYAAKLPNSTRLIPGRKADAIVLSYDIFGGGSSFSPPIADAIKDAANAGVLFVTGSGNGGRLSATYANENAVSALPGVIVVSGSDLRDGAIAGFSTTGSAVDVSAGFNAVTSGVSYNNGQFDYIAAAPGGTSYSAPYVAGLYALAKATYPGLTPAIFSSWITSDRATFPNEYLKGYDAATNANVTRSGMRDDDFGYGVIDAKRVINLALAAVSGAPINALPALSPTVTVVKQSDGKAFTVVVSTPNPYGPSIPLGNLTYDLVWSPAPSGSGLT